MNKKQQRNSKGNKPQRSVVGGTMRVRARALDSVDEEKLTLAFWMLARRLVEDKTDGRTLTREEVVHVARHLDDDDPLEPPTHTDETSA